MDTGCKVKIFERVVSSWDVLDALHIDQRPKKAEWGVLLEESCKFKSSCRRMSLLLLWKHLNYRLKVISRKGVNWLICQRRKMWRRKELKCYLKSIKENDSQLKHYGDYNQMRTCIHRALVLQKSIRVTIIVCTWKTVLQSSKARCNHEAVDYQ